MSRYYVLGCAVVVVLFEACTKSEPSPTIDTPACVAYDGPRSDGLVMVDSTGSGERAPACAPRCGAATAFDGFRFAEALPSGSCTSEPICDLPAVPHCGCAEDRGPVNGYRCRCVDGAWSCRIVAQGGSICRASCGETSVVDASAADTDADTRVAEAGPCGPGKHEAYEAPGCTATARCLPDGPEDACATTFCGCDGKTFSGACGYSPKPFAYLGTCGGAPKVCVADRLPFEGTSCTMASGTYCRLKSCSSGCEDECACRDGTWKCTKSCRDSYGCGAAPSCTDTCASDASADG